MSFFSQLFDETQMSAPLQATRHHNSIKLLILLPLRAYLVCTLQYETPCSKMLSLFIAIISIRQKETNVAA